MSLSALTVANEFIRLSNEEDFELNHLKLQKLLYFAQGWHLAIEKKPLFNETIQAWKYGPVIPIIYDIFKNYGSSSIKNWRFYCSENIDDNTLNFIKNIWNLYKKFDAITLSILSHEKNGPWDKSKNHYMEISIDLIQNFFTEKLNQKKVNK